MCIELMREARSLGASDVHLAIAAPPVVRLWGKLCPLREAPLRAEEWQQLLALLPPAAKESFQRLGEADCALTFGEERCRLNIFRQGGQPAAAVRLLNSALPTCEELGLPDSLCRVTQAEGGLVLVTGSTGCGKSTTLAALTQKLNSERALHIITLEDPVEYLYPPGRALIHQREVGRDTLSFANGLRAALREDPDVILVGELRDSESMSIALTAAETGHLVLATMHTQDVCSSINRFLDALPAKQQVCHQLADALLAVACQKLLPLASGRGRVAAFEVLVMTEAVRHLIREGQTHQLPSFLQTGGRVGMLTMDESAKRLRRAGLIK